MAHNQATMMEPEPMVLYNDPVLLCGEQAFRSIHNGCSFVLQPISNSEIMSTFEPKLYQVRHFPVLSSQETPSYTFQNNQLRLIYQNTPKDQPEFVDVRSLTSACKQNSVSNDDENDVIFVKEYKKEVLEQPKEDGIRRNPIRKARVGKGRGHLQKEHLLEEDFGFLDEFDEENLVLYKNQPAPTNPETSTTQQQIKEWPINVFERPEYNPQNNKIEPFDYTIRNIQNKPLKKKPRLETCIKIKRKSKKKYVIPKRRPKCNKVVEIVPVSDLKESVATTFEMLKDLLSRTGKEVVKGDFYQVVRDQLTLMALVNNYERNEISESVNQLLGTS